MSSDSSSSNDKARRDQERDEKLIRGEIPLGQYLGMPKEMLYKWADDAHTMMMSGQAQKAAEVFEGLVAADPYNSVFHCQLGAAYVTLERLDDAFTAFDQALRFNGFNIDALVGRGEGYLRRGDVPKGLADFTKAIEQDKEFKRGSTQRARQTLLLLKQQVDQAAQEKK